MQSKPSSPTLFIFIAFAGVLLILGGVGFSLIQSHAQGEKTLSTSLQSGDAGPSLVPIPNSAKTPFALMAKPDHDQELVHIDKQRGTRVLVPSIRALVALGGKDAYLSLYASPQDGFLYFLEIKGIEAKPIRYWGMNVGTLTFHSLRTTPPAHGTLSPGENLVAYAADADASGELGELRVISLPLDIEKNILVLGGSETLTIRKHKYTNDPQASITWKNDKTVSFGITSTEFPIGEGRPISETREIEIR